MKKIHFILVLFSVLAISCFAAKDQKKTKKEPKPVTYVIKPDSNTYAILGKTMTDILFSPSKVTCYAVKGKAQVDKSDLELEPHYVRDSLIAKLSPSQISMFQFLVLSDKSNYSQDSVKVRSPYVPQLELCFEKKKQQVHVLISQSDFSWTICYDDKKQGNWNYAEKRLVGRFCKMISNSNIK